MEKIILRALIITGTCCLSTKHVFVNESVGWSKAQEYCRDRYTDLSPITNELEERVFKDFVGKDKSGWIGLFWDSTNHSWRWSGGIKVTKVVRDFTAALYWSGGRWSWRHESYSTNFFCLNLIVVQEEKTWEEALDHCRGTHTDLTSLLSKTENILAQTEIQHRDVTERVWIGLRYLEDSWMWVNGDRLEYKAWKPTGDQEDQCPLWRGCGALTKGGTWENRDCGEKLSFICV